MFFVYLYDLNGTYFGEDRITDTNNYPNFSERSGPTNYVRAITTNALPFLLHVGVESFSGQTQQQPKGQQPPIGEGPPIGPLSIKLQTGNSFTQLDPSKTYQDALFPNSWIFRSWVLPNSNLGNSSMAQLRYTQISSDCNATVLNIFTEICTETTPKRRCYFPYITLPVMSIFSHSRTIFLGFPEISTGASDLVIIGLFNNGSTTCNMDTATYGVVTVLLNLDSEILALESVPGRYSLFVIPYPKTSETRSNITVVVTPKFGNTTLGIFYNKMEQPYGTNFISGTQKVFQKKPLDILTLTFTTEGPHDYVSIYNFGMETALYSVSVGVPQPNSNAVRWWVWLVGAIVFVVIPVGGVAGCVVQRNKKYYIEIK